MINPHGGKLVSRVLGDDAKCELLEKAHSLPKIALDSESLSDVGNIATGVFSPLEGFMGRDDFQHVLRHMRLGSDLPWSIPIVLDVDKGQASALKVGKDIVLADEAGGPMAVLHLEEKYEFDKEEMARLVFQTTDALHPGVAKVLAMKDVLLGGKIDLIKEPPTPFERYKLSPRETRVLFKEKGWRTIVGFQTRNTPHIGHEYVQKAALTFVDGIFINPVIGKKKKGDYKDEVILAAYEELIKNYYLKERPARGHLPRHHPEELRLHAYHHRPRPRRRRELLPSLRRAGHLRRVPRSRHHPPLLPLVLLLQEMPLRREREDLPASAVRPYPVQRDEDPRHAAAGRISLARARPA
jgi:sulfate adenylyltransferase